MDAGSISVRWSGGHATFDGGTVVSIGRDLDVDVRTENSNVSRRHAELRCDGSTWVLTDTASAQGTWRDGRRVERVEVSGPVTVTLGREGRGEQLHLEPLGASGRPGPTELVGSGAVGATEVAEPPTGSPVEGTVIVGQSADRPGGRLRAEAIEGATVVTGGDVHVECAGRTYSFGPGADVVIGRDAACEVVSTNPTVSRRHARLHHDGSSWHLEDLGSSGGLYLDGDGVRSVEVRGSTAVWLGDPSAGERVVMVTSGSRPPSARERKRRSATVAVALVAVLAVIGLGVAVVATRGPSDDALARATVRIIAGDASGSGTIVDAAKGLILTNAHVVAPAAPGQAVAKSAMADPDETNPKSIVVEVAPGKDKEAEPRFQAKVVAVDGYLDLAVIQLTETMNGRIIETDSGDLDDLVQVELADSDEVGSSSSVRVFGYPGATETAAVTFTEGVVSGPVKDARLGSNRGMLNVSAEIRAGNSGGLAVDESGAMIGVPTLVRIGTSSDAPVGSIRPVNFAKPLIEAARAGKDYRSKLIRPLESEQVTNVGLVAAGGDAGIQFSCSTGKFDPASRNVGVAFDFSGFEVGAHQDLLVLLYVGDTLLGGWTLNDEYPVEWPSDSGCATISFSRDAVPSDVPDDAKFGVVVGLGPEYVPV